MDEISPIYFNNNKKKLFGIYHKSSSTSSLKTGVVICNPIGKEYYSYHKLSFNIACKLAKKGLSCFRFDYCGCGESEGSIEENSIQQWFSDIDAAINTLRMISESDKIYLFGFRFGASLAILHGDNNGAFEKIVLWNPVISGKDYTKELVKSHKIWLRGSFAKEHKIDRINQRLGFIAARDFQYELEKINLLDIASLPAESLLLLGNNDSAEFSDFYRLLLALKCDVELENLSDSILPVKKMYKSIEWISQK